MSIRHGLEMGEYLAIDALSSGVAFEAINRSPFHAKHYRLNGEWSKKADFGTVAHKLLLEGNDGGVVVADPAFIDWRKKEAQQIRDEAYAAGKTPILAAAFEEAKRLVTAVREQLESTELVGVFGSGNAEVTVDWEDCGIACKARPDYLTDKYHVSLKTTKASGEPSSFSKYRLGSSGYDFQLAFYDRGLRANGLDVEHRILIVEQEPPFGMCVVALDGTKRAICDAKVDQSIKLWRDCLETSHFPSYPAETYWAEASPWELAEAEAREFAIMEMAA